MSEVLTFVIRELHLHKGRWPELARQCGVSKRTFEKIAHGNTRNPRLDTVEKLASFFRSTKPQ
jgi:transcriptional regulator with XRE-family HTH domain